jgi:hypothetical protein
MHALLFAMQAYTAVISLRRSADGNPILNSAGIPVFEIVEKIAALSTATFSAFNNQPS